MKKIDKKEIEDTNIIDVVNTEIKEEFEHKKSALERLYGFVPQSKYVKIELIDENEEIQEFTIKRFASAIDLRQMAQTTIKRNETLKSQSKKLAVFISQEVIDMYPEHFKDVSEKDGKKCIFITSEEEISLATSIEMAIVEPKMDWATAVIYTRIAAPLTFKLVEKINEVNCNLAIEEAKNA